MMMMRMERSTLGSAHGFFRFTGALPDSAFDDLLSCSMPYHTIDGCHNIIT
jgi:hypothetical protein